MSARAAQNGADKDRLCGSRSQALRVLQPLIAAVATELRPIAMSGPRGGGYTCLLGNDSTLERSVQVVAGLDCITVQFPFAANGRAMTLESTDGFVRVAARRENHRIVGWQAVGAGVSELSTAFSHSLEMGAALENVAGTIHAHPTLGEAVQEAVMRALGYLVRWHANLYLN